jgi:hypothetical protein
VNGVPFKDSTKGELWKANKLGGQYGIVHNTLDSEGNPVHTKTHNGKRLEDEQHPIRFLSSNIDTLNSSDHLIVNISLLQSKANITPDLEEVEVNPPTSTEATTSHSNVDELRALLDTGCLVGDTISQEIVDSLDASHLLYDVNATICSGFNNQCTDKFQCLRININFFNIINSLRENFNTVVIVLKNSPIDLIIGRETIKKENLSQRLPSHFSETRNLTVPRVTQESFADETPEELYRYKYKPSDQRCSERLCPVKEHAHTCKVILNPDEDVVKSDSPLVNSLSQISKTDGKDRIETIPMCNCSKALPQGSRIGRPFKLVPMRINEGDQMVVTIADGENDTQLLRNVTPSIRNDGTNLSRKWLLQENGLYIPVILEKSDSTIDSSMIHISSEKPEPRVSQTWGIIATLIKQQEQLNESHLNTTDSSKVAMDNNRTTSAFTKSEVVTNNYDNDENSSECSNTLDTEPDVFRDFTSSGYRSKGRQHCVSEYENS